MLDKIIHFSIKNKLLIGLFTLGLIAWGGYSLQQIPINAVPDITNNQVQVITVSPSLAAEEVERLITFPVEVTMATIPDIQEIRSFSRFGLSLVTIVFEEEVDVYWARQQVNERLTKAEESIPEGVGKPGMAPVTTGLGEIYQYVVKAQKGYEDQYSAMDLRTIQDWVVRRQLLGTPGVADVSSFGGYLKQYEIALNPDKLKSLNISISEIFQALEDNNENTGGAYIEKNKNAYFIRSEGLVSSLDDIRNIPVKEMGDRVPIFIDDVADVRYGNAVRYGATTMNGEGEVVSAIVMMLKGANSAEVITNVKDRIAEIQNNLPEGVVIEPFLDRSKLVNAAIGTVTKNLLEGALIVIFILVLFLGNIRAGLIVGSVIPLALLFAFGMMSVFGVSANLMSLGALDFGLIVDGAVIIVESIVYKIQSMKNDVADQAQMDNMVSKRAAQIIRPASFGVLIILIVYLPILALSGVEGKMFAPMAQTVSFALLGALILSVTYVPMMSALALSKKSTAKRNISDKIMDVLHRLYDPVLRWALRAKIAVLVFAFVLLGVTYVVFSNMGGEFIPTLEEGDFAVETRVRTGSSLQRTIEATTKAQKILLDKFPEVEKVVGKIGSGEIPTDPMPIEASDLMVILKPKSEWTSASGREELANKMADELAVLPGVSFSFQQPIQMRFNELMTGSRQDVVAKVYGEDLNRLSEYANRVGEVVSTVEGAVDLYIEEVTGIPQVVVDIDRQKIAKFGLSIADVNNTVQAAFSGAEAGLVYEGEKRFDLVVRLDKDQRAGINDIRQLYVVNKDGQQIPLSQVADVQIEDGPYQIQRDDTQRRIMVGFNVRNRDVESVVDEIRQKVNAEIDFDPGYSVAYGGQFENLVDAQQRLAVAVPLALLLIFILLFFAFRSLKLSLLIFTAIPLSAIGGVFALYARGMPFSISAGVGFIALFGVAVLNGIVLIEEFNKLKEKNVKNLHKRIFIGTSVRLRPVLMTASVASLGFLPMALSTSAGAEVQQPLATVVIGGLISATFLTLVVLPVLYYYFEKGISNKLKTGATLFGALMVLSAVGTPVFAQQPNDTVRVFQSEQQLIEVALDNNPGIQAGEYNISRETALKGAAWDLPNTSFTYDRGQINQPAQTDNQIGISQQFSLPFHYARRSKLAKARINASESRQVINKNDLIYQLQSSVQSLKFLRARDDLLNEQIQLMTQFASAARKRFQAGATNLLEQSTAASEAAQVKALHDQNQADITAIMARIKSLVNISKPFHINTDSLVLMDIDLVPVPSAIERNPELELIRSTLEIAKRKKAVEKSRLLPDVKVGFYSQTFKGPGINSAGNETTFTGSDRFNVFQVGLSMPLWFKPEVSRIKAANIERLQIDAELRNRQNQLQGSLEALIQQYYKAQTSIESYYQAELLPQARLLEEQAQTSFKEGAIGYVEYSQALNRALDIKASYLELVNQANQSLIQIKSIIGYNNL